MSSSNSNNSGRNAGSISSYCLSWIPSVQSLGLIMFAFWGVKSFVGYWFLEAEDLHIDFYQVVLEPFGIMDENGPGEWFFVNMIKPAFVPGSYKKYMIRAHVLLGMIMSLSLLIQLTPWIRKRNIKLHRLSGNILLVLFSIQAVPIFYHVWHLPAGWATVWVELPLVPTGAYFGYRGYKQIKAGDVAGHRSSMIMMSPTFFFLGFGRLIVPIFEYVVMKFGKTLGGPLDFDLTALDGEEYIIKVFGSGSIIVLWICYSVAVYNAYIVVPHGNNSSRKDVPAGTPSS